MIIFVIVIIIAVAILTVHFNKQEKIKEQAKMEDKQIEYNKPKEINYEELKNSDIDKLKIEELKKIYIQLITVETKLDRLNRILENIDKNIGLITFIIVLPIIIGILLLSQGIEIGNTIINSIQ